MISSCMETTPRTRRRFHAVWSVRYFNKVNINDLGSTYYCMPRDNLVQVTKDLLVLTFAQLLAEICEFAICYSGLFSQPLSKNRTDIPSMATGSAIMWLAPVQNVTEAQTLASLWPECGTCAAYHVRLLQQALDDSGCSGDKIIEPAAPIGHFNHCLMRFCCPFFLIVLARFTFAMPWYAPIKNTTNSFDHVCFVCIGKCPLQLSIVRSG